MKRLIILSASIILLALMAKAYYDTNTIEIRHFEIRDTRLAEALGGVKIAFLADLHTKRVGEREQKILEIVMSEKPDLILLGGDQISFKGSYQPVTAFLDQLNAPMGVYVVMGNTEYSNENGSCILCHEAGSTKQRAVTSWTVLRDSTATLQVQGTRVNLLGIDDPVRKPYDLRAALRTVDPSVSSILLSHFPQVFEEAGKVGIDLVLSGHTHGGQIFLTRLLRKVIPLEEALRYLDGFFQKGKTLMYVSRGIGTSFLPFRLGVKPEITFFRFANNPIEKIRMTRIDHTNPTSPMNPINPTNALSTVSISNNPSTSIFLSFTLSNLVDTFNVFNVFDSLGITPFPHHRSTAPLQHSSTSSPLFDFESDADLERLNWECGKWFERSQEHVTSGKYSLRVVLPPSQYPGINFEGIRKNWSGSENLRMDAYNPSTEKMMFHIRIDDAESGWEYADRFDINFILESGMNNLMIPTDSVRTNLYHKPLNLGNIERFMVFVPNNNKRRELYLDNIRLE